MKNSIQVIGGSVFCLLLTGPAAMAQDPVKADAKHYKVEFENPRVRVLRISFAPGEKSAMHEHPAGIAVFLTENRAKFNLPDGKAEERAWKAGQTMWLPAEKHLPEALTNTPVELVLIELKGKPAATKSALAQDPVKVDTKHYTVDFENDQVRVVRIKYGPKEKSVMHGHPAGAVTFLTDALFKFTFPDGKSEEIRGKTGESLWFAPFEHLPESLSDKPFEATYIEVK
ncbi:MAG: hypothetical protein L0312_05850 [Acidobacteria bacterium]|nr:hypothetical protein [Acidobacteriota bacterium]